MKIEKNGYIFEYLEETNEIILYNTDGGRYLKLPASVKFKEGGKDIFFSNVTNVFSDNTLKIISESENEKFANLSLSFLLNDDSIEVSFSADAKEDAYVEETELFRNGRKGMYMVDCVRRFTPAPRNNFGVNRAFENVFCDCTMNAYFAPPPLNFCVGNRNGYIAFGLLDLPNSYEYKMTNNLGILVEKCGGKLLTAKGTSYNAPRLLITFPKTNWESISLFREELEKRNLLPEKRKHTPSWWKRPLIVTYGDQIMELQYNWYSDDDWGSPYFTLEWLEMWLDRAEKKLGSTDFTIVVDAFWQHKYSAEAKVDASRFKNMRQFIDKCHEKGHKVLLWSTPLFDNPDNGFQTLAQKFGVLSPDRLTGGIVDGKYYIDYTADNIDEYFYELSRMFFGDDPDALNCDGLKMDFLANLRNPEKDVHYLNPNNGIGIKEMYCFYDKFQKAAQKIKPDVCLNGSGCDPRFENVMAMNRLHDIQNVYEERELRARASLLACPNLIIDSDGAIMLTDWVKETYIKAVVYSTPSLYYVNMFHDGVSLSDEEMRNLGALLSLSAEKTDGDVCYDENGDWKIYSEGRITAQTFGKEYLFICDGKKHFNIFTWEKGKFLIPVYDYTFKEIPENCRITDGILTVDAKAGGIIKLTIEKEAN